MSTPQELQWQAQKEEVQAVIEEFLNAGISLDAARKAAGWNPTYDYDNYSDLTVWPPPPVAIVPVNGLRQYLRLQYSRSESRSNPSNLEGAVLDAGKLYAIFIPDIPELTITQITFELNGSPVHTEFSTPWDYAGTTPGGDSTRLTFIAGTYTIGATVVDAGGFYSFEATFEVE